MALSDTNTYLTSLINAGADAMSNLYYLQVSSGNTSSKTDSVSLAVRTSQIQLPKFTQSTEKKDFMTTSIDVPKAEITGKKEVILTVRLDSEYKLYKWALDQQKLTSRPDLGFAATVVPSESTENKNNGLTLKVYSMNKAVEKESQETYSDANLIPESDRTLLYSFKYCWIKSITRPAFTYDSTTAQTSTITIGFYEFSDPQNELK